jgi:hypothetical protein
MVKLIVKTIVINRKIHKNKRKRFYSSNKEGLICGYKSVTANFFAWFGEPCKEHSYGKVKGKGVIFLTGHIQCKQSMSPRSLELRGNFQTHR